MGRHYDEVDIRPACLMENLSCRVSSDDVQFKPGSSLQLLMADPFKLGPSFALQPEGKRLSNRQRKDVKQVQGCIVFPRKLRCNRNRRKRALVEIHRAKNIAEVQHSQPF